MRLVPTTAPDIPLPDRIETDVVILPRELGQDGRGLYDDSVLTLAKALRAEGATADYQHDSEHRNWIGERSATAIVLSIVVGIASNAGWAGLKRLLSTTHAHDHVRGKVARCIQHGDRTTWEWFEFEGQGDEVGRALREIAPPDRPHSES